MTISAKIIAHSTYEDCENPLVTWELKYPRHIHSEVMTHRVFSRNAASSRAIPIQKLIAAIRNDPALPEVWGIAGRGMQHVGVMTDDAAEAAKSIWLRSMQQAIERAKELHAIGASKQIVNRLIENYGHITVVLSSTTFDNFFALRRDDAAEPHIRILADKMYERLQSAIPRALDVGEWHLPYVGEDERESLAIEDQIIHSVARCARTSYRTHDARVSTIEEDRELHKRLVGSSPLHASPAEHQATPYFNHCDLRVPGACHDLFWLDRSRLCGNFAKGWIQYRKLIPGENVQHYDACSF